MNQTAYIVYSTPNYKRLYNNFFFSLVGIGVDAKHIFHKLDNPNIKGRGFQSNLWYYCVRKKVEHFKTILKEQIKNYKYFICSDCDIVFIYKNKQEWDNLYKFVDNSDKQIFYMQEGENEGINAGLTVHGTVGSEYPYFNVPIVNASKNNPHMMYDFNYLMWALALSVI